MTYSLSVATKSGRIEFAFHSRVLGVSQAAESFLEHCCAWVTTITATIAARAAGSLLDSAQEAALYNYLIPKIYDDHVARADHTRK